MIKPTFTCPSCGLRDSASHGELPAEPCEDCGHKWTAADTDAGWRGRLAASKRSAAHLAARKRIEALESLVKRAVPGLASMGAQSSRWLADAEALLTPNREDGGLAAQLATGRRALEASKDWAQRRGDDYYPQLAAARKRIEALESALTEYFRVKDECSDCGSMGDPEDALRALLTLTPKDDDQ